MTISYNQDFIHGNYFRFTSRILNSLVRYGRIRRQPQLQPNKELYTGYTGKLNLRKIFEKILNWWNRSINVGFSLLGSRLKKIELWVMHTGCMLGYSWSHNLKNRGWGIVLRISNYKGFSWYLSANPWQRSYIRKHITGFLGTLFV